MGQPARYPTVLAVWVNRSSETSAVAVQTNFVRNHIRGLSHRRRILGLSARARKLASKHERAGARLFTLRGSAAMCFGLVFDAANWLARWAGTPLSVHRVDWEWLQSEQSPR